MTVKTKYTAWDLARHRYRKDDILPVALAGSLAHHWENGRDEVTAAEVVADTCVVGYGGHYHEVMEDDAEGEALNALADHLGPLHGMAPAAAYGLLEQVRLEFTGRLVDARDQVLDRWAKQGFIVEVDRQSLDDCPACGKRIKDFDDAGCEDGVGQRWCVAHALEALPMYRPLPGRRS